ncbi:ABC transporter ATP-binding protein [Lentisphaera profundi]|uniref:ABC transporter ATP-binding protein n=1 Tax=Lentisphaera profundi TaxID=1658616 RepID=A0ABY7VR27_9BACT|nr:ABC transporter ATP-binding protein [Lentisphaera profundi]WDE95695.1 ABC transporter ATP-binding protein [Lentisphaera profundi]
MLQLKNLSTTFDLEDETICAVDQLSFDLPQGKTLGIVGESGSGKSVSALSILRLLPKPMGKSTGKILLDGQNILALSPNEMLKIRGNKISMIFQEPMTALNPVHSVSKQLMETFFLHFPGISKSSAWDRSLEMLTKVGIPAPEKRMHEFPHQLSGGMRQRVMIAIALSCEPDILIADEPTTALDVTVQAQIIDLMKDLQKKNNMSIIFITHDLGVVAETCDEVLVMYGGRMVEHAPVIELFEKPSHPYTKALMASLPQLSQKRKTELKTIPGLVPSLKDLNIGCRFGPRSGFSHSEESLNTRPEIHQISPDHRIEWCPDCQNAMGRSL